jgi:hypothetical protein
VSISFRRIYQSSTDRFEVRKECLELFVILRYRVTFYEYLIRQFLEYLLKQAFDCGKSAAERTGLKNKVDLGNSKAARFALLP